MTDFLALNRAVFQSGLTLNEQSVLLALIDHLPNCAPSATRLEQWAKLSRSAVFRALASLEGRGVVRTTKQPGRPNMYTIDHTKLPTSVSQTPVPVSPRHQSQDDTSVCGTRGWCLPDTGVVSVGHGGSVSQTPKGTKEGSNEGTKEGSVLTRVTPPAEIVTLPPTHSDVMTRPIQDRAKWILENPYRAMSYEPHRWPEVVLPLEALAEADGKAKPKPGSFSSDKSVRLLLEHYAAGWSQAELVEIYRATPSSTWWLGLRASQKRPGASWMSPEVLRRYEPGSDVKGDSRAALELARRQVATEKLSKSARLVAEVEHTQALLTEDDDGWGTTPQLAAQHTPRLTQ